MVTDEYIHRRNEVIRRALAFLNEVLSRGAQPLSLIREHGITQGISLSMLLTAETVLNVKSRKIEGRAVWSLPGA